MQGINPAEAFASLPASMRGTDELDDGLSVQDTITTEPSPSAPTPATTNPSDVLEEDSPMRLLDREEVTILFVQFVLIAYAVFRVSRFNPYMYMARA